MPDLSEIRLREDAPDVRWVLFIDGIPYAWTTDLGQGGRGSLRGSGASSWIGRSEDAIGGVEVVGARTVLGGLELPPTIRESLDVKAGELEPNPITIRLHDVDGLLPQLFGREGKTTDVLRERIGPGTDALPATGLGPGGTVIGLWGRHIGLERIGTAGERRLFPAIPFELVGFDHAVHQDAPFPGELPPVLVSDEPLQWTGRLVTLYEVYRDPDDTSADASAWPTWDLQHAAGQLAWVGVVRGVSRQRGGVWELACHGRDALLRRTLGAVTTATWMPITAELNLTEEQAGFGVWWEHLPVGQFPRTFNGSILAAPLTSTTKLELVDEIDGVIQDALDGTSTNNVGDDGDLDTWTVGADSQNPTAGIIDTDGFYVSKATQSSDQELLIMYVLAHRRVWGQLGYEPETQAFDARNTATDDARQIVFERLDGGQEISGTYGTGVYTPGPDYWIGRFTTAAVGATEDISDSNDWDNGSSERYWPPKFTGEPYSIDLGGNGQIVRLGGGASPYIEGQLTVYHSGADVDGSPSTRARFFALRGKVLPAVDAEPVETVQVGLFEWDESPTYGSVSPGAGAVPALRLVQWLDPRTFGLNYRKLGDEYGLSYWTGVGSGEGAIEVCPLHAYAWRGDDQPEFAFTLFLQVLVSTGAGGGYDTAGMITEGPNSPDGALAGVRFWCADLELADLGLGIPQQLVGTVSEIFAAFNDVPGGWAGPLNRVRYAYLGPFLAQDMLSSLLRSRRLMMRTHGGRISVVRLAPFGGGEADITLTERDLYDSEPPEQLPAPVGQLDGMRLSYRWDPIAGKTQLEHLERARDPAARSRTGELIEPVEDHGLMPTPWGLPPSAGVGPWWDDIRQVWAYEGANFYSEDHYALSLLVSRPKGQDLATGTRVLLGNPWPHNNAGGYGIVDHVGIVTAVDIDTATHARRAETFVFAGQGAGYRYFAPHPRILDQAGATLTLSTDQYGHGNPAIRDGDGLSRPSWSTASTACRIQILYRIGETWALGGQHDVVSYDRDTAQLVLDSAPDTSIQYADRWVILAPFEDQDPDSYTRSVFGVIVRDDLTHGSGTVGRPFHP